LLSTGSHDSCVGCRQPEIRRVHMNYEIGCRLDLCSNKVNSTDITTHTHIHLFNDPLSGTTRASQYQKGKTNQDFTEARDSEWQ